MNKIFCTNIAITYNKVLLKLVLESFTFPVQHFLMFSAKKWCQQLLIINVDYQSIINQMSLIIN
jgi:hypothetical protein